ncbi:group XIIB secretory phospholipase A2-like protein isoform X1 [Corythoichthys intestinalis]|uniref:group XIIB secretory phospholipase A2-like protein isoform X1 n=1 Tax=Corythoichthys intestinalis TaxID=161448 RepID=UPI0025A535BD|nr:group XIIB secretory phospholipase A2-like protein isoform X1 [Corythoichthys intestinalis]
MLLRAVALLLLLYVSVSVCATLGHYQSITQQEEVAVVEPQNTAVEEVTINEDHNNELSEVLLDKTPELVNDTGESSQDVDGQQQISQDGEEMEERNDIEPVQTDISALLEKNSSNHWSLMSIRNSFQTVHGYFDSLVELVGGHNGVCQYRCRYGELPQPRPGYKHQEPNGCSSSMVGFQLDLGIPAMTECCNHLDVCYDNCGINKYDCDTKFRSCLHNICSDLKRSLGFVSKVQACESVADALYNTVWTLGCRPYMNSQRAACVCEGEERDEL